MTVSVPHVFGTLPPAPPTPASFFDDNFNALVAGINAIIPGIGSPVVNAQTGVSYTVLGTDTNKLLTFSNAGAIAVSLPQAGVGAFVAPWAAIFTCLRTSTGAVTITPVTSTIDGQSTLVLQPGAAALVVIDAQATAQYQIARYFSPTTKAAMQTATDATTNVTPAQMVNHDGIPKALVSFTGSTGAIVGPAGSSSVNVTSITRNGAGDYTITFTTAFTNTVYVCSIMGVTASPANNQFLTPFVDTPATGTCRIKFFRNTATGVVDTDPTTVHFAAWGRQ